MKDIFPYKYLIFLKNYFIYFIGDTVNYFFNCIINLSPKRRRFFLYFIDISILIFVILYISWNNLGISISDLFKEYSFFLAFLFLTFIPFNIITNKYKTVSKYINSFSIYKFAFYNLVYLLFLIFICFLSNKDTFLIKDLCLLFFLLSISQAFSRIFIRDYINLKSAKKYFNAKKTLIYGAGSAGAQLLNLINADKGLEVIGFIDDKEILWGRELNGKIIYNPKKLFNKNFIIDQVFIAIPSISKKRFKEICDFLQHKKLNVQIVPSLKEILYKSKNINQLRPIREEDLLGREQIKPDIELLRKAVDNKVVVILGAGGSIGSEISLQILDLNPKEIILIDIDEHSSYKINQLMNEKNINNKKISTFLGDVKYEPFLKNIFAKFNIDVVFHAAAYKHVPLLENNQIEGLRNNIFSTSNICKLAEKYKIKKVILISSDKAVRPTNIMGCSKRICELIFLYYANKNLITKFSIVRFGNVLGSSGSVVPLFRKQLQSGGPITLTHPLMERYFMTISEASQLVIQTTSLTSGKDIFLLDMGEPVLIYDLARKMINLSGFELRDENNENGDIEIKFSGLRVGEKMSEELLIGSNSSPTIHPLIFKASEDIVLIKDIEKILEELSIYIDKNDKESINLILKSLVPESNYQILS